MNRIVTPQTKTAYAELQVTTNFSFLEGGSHPHELIVRAAELGLSAIAIADRNSVAGLVRAHLAARELDVRLIAGCRAVLYGRSAGFALLSARPRCVWTAVPLLTVGKSDRVFKEKGKSSGNACFIMVRDGLRPPHHEGWRHPHPEEPRSGVSKDEAISKRRVPSAL